MARARQTLGVIKLLLELKRKLRILNFTGFSNSRTKYLEYLFVLVKIIGDLGKLFVGSGVSKHDSKYHYYADTKVIKTLNILIWFKLSDFTKLTQHLIWMNKGHEYCCTHSLHTLGQLNSVHFSVTLDFIEISPKIEITHPTLVYC